MHSIPLSGTRQNPLQNYDELFRVKIFEGFTEIDYTATIVAIDSDVV